MGMSIVTAAIVDAQSQVAIQCAVALTGDTVEAEGKVVAD